MDTWSIHISTDSARAVVQHAAADDDDTSIAFFDLRDHVATAQLAGSRLLCVSPTARHFISTSRQLFSHEGRMLGELDRTCGTQFSPDGTLIVGAWYDIATLFSVGSLRNPRRIFDDLGYVDKPHVNDEGEVVVVGGESGVTVVTGYSGHGHVLRCTWDKMKPLAISPCGRTFVAADDAGVISLVDSRSFSVLGSWSERHHRTRLWCFSPDERLVAYASDVAGSEGVVVCCGRTGQELWRQRHLSDDVTVIRFLGPSGMLLSAGVKGPVSVSDAASGRLLTQLEPPACGKLSVGWDDSTRSLSLGSRDVLTRWHIDSDCNASLFQELRFTQDTSCAEISCTATSYGSVGDMELAAEGASPTGCGRPREPAHSSAPLRLCRFASDNERLFTETEAGRVQVWGKSGLLLHQRQLAVREHVADVSPGGDRVAVVGHLEGEADQRTASIWHVESDTVVRVPSTRPYLLSAAFSRDGRSLFVASTADWSAGAVERYDLASQRLTPLVEVHHWWGDGDGDPFVLALGHTNGAALDWAESARTRGLEDWPDAAREVRMSHTGTLLIAFPRQGWYARDAPSLWTASTLAHHGELGSCLTRSNLSFAFTPDDALVAVADRDSLLFFDVGAVRRQSVLRLEDARSVIWDMRFCPAGALVALAVKVAGAHAVQVWDWKTETLVGSIPIEGRSAAEISWSSDGSRLAAAVDGRGTVVFWSATTFAEIGSLTAG